MASELKPVSVGLGWFAGSPAEERKKRMDSYLVSNYGRCGCGKPVQYIVPNSDEPGACNKYARCPTYDDLLQQIKKLKGTDGGSETNMIDLIRDALELAEENSGNCCPLSSDACGERFEQIRDLLKKAVAATDIGRK